MRYAALSAAPRTLPVSCGPQEKTLGIPHKACAVGRQLHWVVFGWARPCAYLSDHLVRPKQHDRRNREPEGLGRLQVDDQLEFHGLLHG
jgi:hypothetical protein